MYNGIYQSLWYYTESFHCSKHPLWFVGSPSQQPNPYKLLIVFIVSRMAYTWIQTVCSLFQIDFFHLVICILGSSMSFPGFITHLFSVLNNIPPLTLWRASWLLPSFGSLWTNLLLTLVCRFWSACKFSTLLSKY